MDSVSRLDYPDTYYRLLLFVYSVAAFSSLLSHLAAEPALGCP